MRVLVTRTAEDGANLARRLEAMGHEAVIEPLLAPDYLSAPIDVSGARTLIVTSRHALDALARQPAALEASRALVIATVGAATTERARTLGLLNVLEGPGAAADLATLLLARPDAGAAPYLHLSGDEVAVDLVGRLVASGIAARRLVVYRMIEAVRLSEAVRQDLADGRIHAVVLMSPRTARIYAGLVDSAGLRAPVGRVRHACISAAVAEQLEPLGALEIRIAPQPRLDELLTVIS